MKIAYYLTFVFTVWIVQSILIHFPYAGQTVLYNSIIFVSVGLVAVAYVVLLLSIRREKRGKPSYPSTVRARIQGGLRNGASSR